MTDDEWQAAPEVTKFIVERYGDNSGWTRCAFEELRKGDVVRFFTCDGDPIHPSTYADEVPDCRTMAIVDADAFKNTGLTGGNWNGAAVGYCAPITVCEREGVQ